MVYFLYIEAFAFEEKLEGARFWKPMFIEVLAYWCIPAEAGK